MAIYFKRFISALCLIVILAAVMAVDSSFSTVDMPKRILFISSYHESFETVPKQIKGIKEALEGSQTLLDIDYMDTKRVDTKENYENYLAFLSYRLSQGVLYDAVLVGDDNALQFLMDHRTKLFKETPVIFFCVNDTIRAAKASEMPYTTGIVEGISLKDNLDLSKKLFPNAKVVYGITDNTLTGKGDEESFLAAARLYPELTFKRVNASEYTTAGLKLALSEIEADSIVIYMSLFEDGEGRPYTISEAVALIAQTVKAPVFRMSIGGVGEGLLGGNMVSYEGQGRMAAQMAIKVINGVDIDTIDLVPKSPNLNVFDYQVMQRFHLNIRDLPEGSLLLNAPVNYFDKYRAVLIPAGAVVFLLVLVVLILMRDIRQLREKDRALELANDELAALYEEMAASEEELRYQYEQLHMSQEALYVSEERYKQLAYTDTLTGLSNRQALLEYLNEATQDISQSWHLIYLDLDNFKFINDSRGHGIGDQILRILGHRLMTANSGYQFVSRLGGDEFVVIVKAADRLGELHEALEGLMKAIERVIHLDELTFYMSCSMGIASFPTDGTDGDNLLRKADMAMYQAKQGGRNKYECYNQGIETALTEKMRIQTQIRTALKNGEFFVVFQPQCHLEDGSLMGVEALSRWQTASGSFIAPDQFIPIAEEQGLIRALGKQVYHESFKMALRWQAQKQEALHVSINVSVQELNEPDYAAELLEAIAYYGLSTQQVAVEITESILIDARGQAILQLEVLRNAGVEIQLDDFGTGYSSLNYLLQLPLDTIKIDRGFIKDILDNKYYEEMAKSIIDMAHRINLKVIAEGVECEAQLQALKAMGCDAIQGYYYAKPLTADALMAFQEQD